MQNVDLKTDKTVASTLKVEFNKVCSCIDFYADNIENSNNQVLVQNESQVQLGNNAIVIPHQDNTSKNEKVQNSSNQFIPLQIDLDGVEDSYSIPAIFESVLHLRYH